MSACNPHHCDTVAGASGVVSEYLEFRRLGKLFDEWKAKQADEAKREGADIEQRTPSRKAGAGEEKSATAAGRRQSATGASKQKPKKTRATHRSRRISRASIEMDEQANMDPWSNLDADGEVGGAAAEYGSDTSEHTQTRVNERTLVSKLFGVVSNPRPQNTGETICDPDRPRNTSYIEGFPTLNLMKLYRGPWRLEF